MKPTDPKSGTKVVVNKGDKKNKGTPMIYYSTTSQRLKFGLLLKDDDGDEELKFEWSAKHVPFNYWTHVAVSLKEKAFLLYLNGTFDSSFKIKDK